MYRGEVLVRHIRVAFLAAAAWALLFAPGLMSSEAGAAETATHNERVGAAVIAPTFTDGPLLVQSGCRRAFENLNDCSVETQWGLVAPPVLLAAGAVLATRSAQGHRGSARQRLVRLFSRRGPPLS